VLTTETYSTNANGYCVVCATVHTLQCTALHACAQQGAAAAVGSAAQYTLVEAPVAAVNSASSSIKSAVSSATDSVRSTVSNASNSAVQQVSLHKIHSLHYSTQNT
jgi:hypothetical protein